jgi:hypothetical protein
MMARMYTNANDLSAELERGLARRRLREQQRATVLGIGDPEALDEAIFAWRRAAAGSGNWERPGEAHWHFARWLIEAAHRDKHPPREHTPQAA